MRVYVMNDLMILNIYTKRCLCTVGCVIESKKNDA